MNVTAPLRRTALLLVLSLACAPGSARAQLLYTPIDLGQAGLVAFNGAGINNGGWAASSIRGTTGFNRGLVTDGTTSIVLNPLGGNALSANALNDAGIVVGQTGIGNGASHAFRYDSSAALPAVQDLGTLGGSTSVALGVNGNGLIVGRSQTAAGAQHGFLYDPSTQLMTDLASLSNATIRSAFGVNNSGLVVGIAVDVDDNLRAFRYNSQDPSATAQDLGDFGGVSSSAYAINNAGFVVGEADTVDAFHAFLSDGAMLTDLGVLGSDPFLGSVAYGINSAGMVVGYSNTDDFEDHAFVYTNGKMRDLNKLLYGVSGWQINYAYSINDAGWIIASGSAPGSVGDRLILLQPTVASTPEPGMPALAAGLGLAMAAAWRRRPRRNG